MYIATPADQEKVKQYLKEANKAMLRKKEEEDNIRDILATLKQDHDIAPKLARKVMAAMIKGNMPEVKEENDAFEDLYEIVS